MIIHSIFTGLMKYAKTLPTIIHLQHITITAYEAPVQPHDASLGTKCERKLAAQPCRMRARLSPLLALILGVSGIGGMYGLIPCLWQGALGPEVQLLGADSALAMPFGRDPRPFSAFGGPTNVPKDLWSNIAQSPPAIGDKWGLGAVWVISGKTGPREACKKWQEVGLCFLFQINWP